jgi:hypothetical protein
MQAPTAIANLRPNGISDKLEALLAPNQLMGRVL